MKLSKLVLSVALAVAASAAGASDLTNPDQMAAGCTGGGGTPSVKNLDKVDGFDHAVLTCKTADGDEIKTEMISAPGLLAVSIKPYNIDPTVLCENVGLGRAPVISHDGFDVSICRDSTGAAKAVVSMLHKDGELTVVVKE